MKRLDTHKFPNASAVIFRTFFEISVLHYLKKHHLPANQTDTLRQVTERAITHLTANHPTPNYVKDAVKPVRAGFSVRDGLFGIQTFHDYVHSAKRHPLPTELRSQWRGTIFPISSSCSGTEPMPATYTPLRYPGGKNALAGFLRDVIKANNLRNPNYVEPYCGGAGAALNLLFSEVVSDVYS